MAAVLVQSLNHFLEQEIRVGSFPGAGYAIGSTRALEHENALGNAVAVPLRLAATPDTIYDCASLTKVLVTTILVLQAVAEKRIALDDEYRGYTYRELLTHTSGLRAWLPLYALSEEGGRPVRPGGGRDVRPLYVRAIEERGPEHPRGSQAVYSDLNFVLLYHALHEIFGDYVSAARERIFAPLGLRDAMFNPPASLRPRIAATEWGQRFEFGMCASRSIAFHGFRQGLMWGETNDGNSFHAGGTCGNAGLFATARDVFRIAQAFACGELVPPALVEESTRVHAGDRGLGWQISELGYGHNGFTGTSLWIDGERISVLLTNRVHPCAAPIAMQRIRSTFHGMKT
ncbi:MAG TPA: serine hydrolase domain-containing protein [Thermoanaerobaculia bacterium]|nr:serine hydrolase domain-containing protein [Thermoanaerobaculia bacterium]